MPRKDKTYKSRDIIRFFCFNLDKKEQNAVLLFFMVIYPAFFTFDAIIDVILFLIPGRIGRVLDRIFFVAGLALSRFAPQLLTLLVDDRDKDAVLKCLEALNDDQEGQ